MTAIRESVPKHDLLAQLAKLYHTTPFDDNFVIRHRDGIVTLVGIEMQLEAPPPEARRSQKDRCLFYAVDNPANMGSILLGDSFCSWSERDPAVIRQAAITFMAKRLADAEDAARQVDLVMDVGGMLWPQVDAPSAARPC